MPLPLVSFLALLVASAAVPQSDAPDETDRRVDRRSGPIAATSQPNVLVVLLDDVGVDSVSAYGEGVAPPTPEIDALAASGVLFRNAWSAPVCSPTRAALLTGRYGLRTGIGELVRPYNEALHPSEVTLPEMLDAGTGGAYANAAFGKWHLGNSTVGGALAPNVAGFAHFDGTLENIRPPEDYFSWTRTVDGSQSVETTYATTVVVDAALAWIASAPQPWFAYVAFHAGHSPYHAPPAHLHSQDLSSAPPVGEDPRPYYVAMVEAMDAEIGRLVAGLPKHTTVIVAGDNGTPGEVTVAPFAPAKAKKSLYEGGVNVPLVVRGPQVGQAGSESAALVHVADVFATAAELAGVDFSAALPGLQLDSVSFLPLVADPALPSTRKSVFSEAFLPNTQGPPPAPPPCGPPLFVCQPDLGFGGPGSAVLTVCGDELRVGNEALLEIQGIAPFGQSLLVRSAFETPIPVLGGTFVAWPPLKAFLLVADGAGRVEFPLFGGGAPLSLYYQALVEDPGLPSGIGITNAVRADHLPGHLTAIRDEAGYKIWSNQFQCSDEKFFDLVSDPFEQSPLDPTSLTGPALAAYNALKAELATLGLN